MTPPRLILDGNNLLPALADQGAQAGRAMLCELIARYVEATGGEACIVFDGFAPRGAEAERLAGIHGELRFSEDRTADEVIREIVRGYSAPRTLTVISSDRQVRRAAAARRAKTMRSDDFARLLLTTLRHADDAPPPPLEPPEKKTGLAEGELDDWLDEFGFLN